MSGDGRLSKDSGRVQTPAFENVLPDAGIPLTKLGSRNTPNNASSKGPVADVSSVSHDNPGLDSKTSQVLGRVQYLSLCFTFFLAGWNDGTIGPLLPRIQEVYNVCTPLVIISYMSHMQYPAGQLHSCIDHFHTCLRREFLFLLLLNVFFLTLLRDLSEAR